MSELFLSLRERRGSRVWWAWVLEEAAFALLLAVVALLPWIFSTTQLDAIELPKQTFILASGGLVWLLLVLRDVLVGKVEFPWDRASKLAVGSVVVLGVLACVSRDPYGSWVGINKQIATSVFTMIAGMTWWFAIRRLVQSPVRFMLTGGTFLVSTGLLALGTGAWLLNMPLWPWSRLAAQGITPLGTVSDTALVLVPVALLAAAILVQGGAMVESRGKHTVMVVRLLAGVVLLACLLLIGAVSSPVLWAASMAGVFMYAWAAPHKKERRIWTGGAVVLLALVVLSAFSPSWDPWRKLGDRLSLAVPAEVALSARASWPMAWQGLKTDPLLGRGAGTWVNLFLQERDPALNQSPYSAVRFFQGSSSAVTAVGTMGVFGIFALLVWLLLPLSTFRIRRSVEPSILGGFTIYVLVPWIAFVVLWLGSVFTTASVLLFWFVSALFVATRTSKGAMQSMTLFGKKRSLVPVILIVLGAGALLWGSMQRLIAEQMFVAGKTAFAAGNIAVAKQTLALAKAWNPANDVYAALLSQVYGEEIRLAFTAQPNQQELARIITILHRAEVLNARARSLNPDRSESWLAAATLATTHAALEPRSRENEDVVNALKRAAELEPTNTRIALALGTVYGQRVEAAYPLLQEENKRVRAQATQQVEEGLREARVWFERARFLDARNEEASLSLAQLAFREGKLPEAIREVETVIRSGNASQDLQVQLALLYVQADQDELAMRLLEAVIAEHTSDASPLARYHLAELYVASIRYEEALGLLQGLTAQFPEEAVLQKRYAEIQRLLVTRPVPKTFTVPAATSSPALVPKK